LYAFEWRVSRNNCSYCRKSELLNHAFTPNQLCIDTTSNHWTWHLQLLQCTMLCVIPHGCCMKGTLNNIKLLVSRWSIQYFGNESNSQRLNIVYGGTYWWLNLMFQVQLLENTWQRLRPIIKIWLGQMHCYAWSNAMNAQFKP
jgi:hypothetical protein